MNGRPTFARAHAVVISRREDGMVPNALDRPEDRVYLEDFDVVGYRAVEGPAGYVA